MPGDRAVPFDARTTADVVPGVEPAAAGHEQPGQLRLHRGDDVANVGAPLDQQGNALNVERRVRRAATAPPTGHC